MVKVLLRASSGRAGSDAVSFCNWRLSAVPSATVDLGAAPRASHCETMQLAMFPPPTPFVQFCEHAVATHLQSPYRVHSTSVHTLQFRMSGGETNDPEELYVAPHAPSPSWCSIGGQRAPALEPARTLRRERPVLRETNLLHCCFVTNAFRSRVPAANQPGTVLCD